MDLVVITFHIMLKFACKCVFKVLFPLILFQLDAVNLYRGGTPQQVTSLHVITVIETIQEASFTWTQFGWSNVTE